MFRVLMKRYNPSSKDNARKLLIKPSAWTKTGYDHSPRRIAVKIVVDACAWIEIFIGSERGKRAKEILEQADEVYTPDTVMAEVARKYCREGAEERTTQARLEIIAKASDIVPIDIKLALEAARCYTRLTREAKRKDLTTPSLFDAIPLAAARLLKAKILTGDEHFKNLPETIWVK